MNFFYLILAPPLNYSKEKIKHLEAENIIFSASNT